MGWTELGFLAQMVPWPLCQLCWETSSQEERCVFVDIFKTYFTFSLNRNILFKYNLILITGFLCWLSNAQWESVLDMFGHENEHYSNHFTTCKNLVLSTYLQKLHGFPIFNYGHFKTKIVNISEVKGDPKKHYNAKKS